MCVGTRACVAKFSLASFRVGVTITMILGGGCVDNRRIARDFLSGRTGADFDTPRDRLMLEQEFRMI
jgi:hypothetical protein